jgi:DNA polymerase III gamma/tau subunit
MTPFLCDIAIDFDAQSAYHASDIEKLINQIQTALTEAEGRKVVVVLKNAHYLTMKAFSVLYDYIREPHSNVVLVLVSSDKSRIFPPLLEYVQTTVSAA